MGSVGAGSGNFGLLGQQNSARWEIFGSANGKILRVLGISAAPGILRTAGFAESASSRGSANGGILRIAGSSHSGNLAVRRRGNRRHFAGGWGTANGKIRRSVLVPAMQRFQPASVASRLGFWKYGLVLSMPSPFYYTS